MRVVWNELVNFVFYETLFLLFGAIPTIGGVCRAKQAARRSARRNTTNNSFTIAEARGASF
jgi:hypothetical protein